MKPTPDTAPEGDTTHAEPPPPACVMSFNGSDPSGAGGLAGDICTIAAMGAHALPVVTAIVMRDTAEVFDQHPIEAEAVVEQARSILEDVTIAGWKVGFLGSAEIFLRQGGHEVVLAEDGFDALSKVNDHDPQLIFCDILMPRLDGYQTCAIIKRNPRFAHVPVIMLSSKDGLFDKARGRMVGSEEYLTKPFTKEQLLRAVETFRPSA